MSPVLNSSSLSGAAVPQDQAIWWNLLALLGYIIFWFFAAYACLRVFNWGRR